MAALSALVLRAPEHGVCSSTPGRVREVQLAPDSFGFLLQQAGGTSGTLYVTTKSGYTDEAASPTLGVADDQVTILPTGEATLHLGPPTSTGSARSIFVASDTASATFKVVPLGIEVMR